MNVKISHRSNLVLLFFLIAIFATPLIAPAQERKEKKPSTPGPMLEQGFLDVDTPEFDLKLVRSSQTVAALKPKGADGFDFTPGDLLVERSQDGYYHLGDLDLRVRRGKTGEWKDYSTAYRRTPVTVLPTKNGILAAADLTPAFPADMPLEITRAWMLENGKLVLKFVLQNKTPETVQVGALGIAMIFNNVLNDRSLEEAHAKCSFYDPYIGEDAGYLQVTRLSGRGPALLVVPDGETPLEAYNPILDNRGTDGPAPIFHDPTPRGVTFEGFYDWMIHSQAFAENEWKNAEPWNPPTMLTLVPGQAKTYKIKFLLSDSIRHLEKTLEADGRPVAIGVPGYILPTDMPGRLFLKYPKAILSMTVEPEEALTVHKGATTAHGWDSYSVTGNKWGRARLTIAYQDGLVQTVSYYVIKPQAQAVADMGDFLFTRQWFTDLDDPFHRAPSVMTYDREENKIVLQDSRAWIAGLSDEGGAGSWLAAIMKEFGEPNPGEIKKFEEFVDGVLWGGLQYKDGPHPYGVRKSLFYYQPDQMPAGFYRSDLDWSTWSSWNQKAAERVDRSYNYPHVAAAYWVLYRLARNHHGLVTKHLWNWYLTHAYETSMAMTEDAKELAVFGQMEGDIFLMILEDLKREGMKTEAQALEAAMKARADRWEKEAYPFGSEMPWDSTGQEEVYAWMKYFGYQSKADVTLNAVLGYDPAIPHWGYNGSARRYWDFIYAAKDRRLERQLHHYGSGLNAIPVLAEYREHPDDFYLLRVGYGGTMGALTDIDQDGFASAAFHAFPDMLKPDPLSGDYGPNFFGHAVNTATYIVHHPEFGWLAFGGDIKTEGATVTITPLDSFRMRVYVASLGLWLTLDAGKFESVDVDLKTHSVRIGIAAATTETPQALLRVEQPAKINGVGKFWPAKPLAEVRGAYVVPLGKNTTWITLRER
jgi:Family of unknown function (DUF5695)